MFPYSVRYDGYFKVLLLVCSTAPTLTIFDHNFDLHTYYLTADRIVHFVPYYVADT